MINTLYGRLALAYAALMLLCGGVTAWVYADMTSRHQQEVLQRLSKDLAGHIGTHTDLVRNLTWNRPAVDDLLHMLMSVNPSIEVYLLNKDGHVDAHVAPENRVKRDWVDLAPVREFLAGKRFPILGDDPRSLDTRKIFSVAPLVQGGTNIGYLYVILAGEDYERLAAGAWASQAYSSAAWAAGGLTALTLVVGLIGFAVITRRLRRLTAQVKALEHNGIQGGDESAVVDDKSRDEIGVLARAFHHMSDQIRAQLRELRRQDSLRREMVANISHDLRTPLTSLQGYLETLQLKEDTLNANDRRRYLDIAVRHSREVSKLSQELFELAKLECEVVKPQAESFALAELVQDVLQKFELPASKRAVNLSASVDATLPPVIADIGLIERVLTNLIDNALRHTPPDGRVRVEASVDDAGAVRVRIQDTGSGIPADKRALLFERPSPISDGQGRGRSSGGLGLLIVKRILNLHGSSIRLEDSAGPGAAFSFALPTA